MMRYVVLILITVALGRCGSMNQALDTLALSAVPRHTGAAIYSEKEQALLKIGDGAAVSGDLAMAARTYSRLAALQPNLAPAYIKLGQCLVMMDDGAAAMPVFRHALDLLDKSGSDTASVDEWLGKAALQVDDLDVAKAAFTAALAIDPNRTTAWNGKGVALDRAGDHHQAVEAYHRGLALSPDDPAIWNNLALSALLDGDPVTAIQILTKLTSGPNVSARIRQNLALAYGLKGDLPAARIIAKPDLDAVQIANNATLFKLLQKTESSTIEPAGVAK